ncbi:sugar transporter SWEET1-like [Schistocerca nitens]|uniref:sugar transporter SWEET1-like n=1 Tax=Schistocerca nitens TaxID=7011 RepID=UPI0021196B0E|nr:sugar transporter SWEET1-like [Schistocerca nitens]
MPLSDYKDLVGTVASYAAIAQMLSGTIVCRNFARQGTTRGMPPTMFVMGGTLGVVLVEFARIMKDAAMLRANRAIMLLNLGYLACYWYYCDDRPLFYRTLTKATVLAAGLLTYARLEDPAVVEFRFGAVLTVLFFFLVASPLFSLREIIRTKNSISIPLPMVLSGTVVTLLWLLYGLMIGSAFLIFQNVIVLVLSVAQLGLVIIYPRTLPPEESKGVDYL